MRPMPAFAVKPACNTPLSIMSASESPGFLKANRCFTGVPPS